MFQIKVYFKYPKLVCTSSLLMHNLLEFYPRDLSCSHQHFAESTLIFEYEVSSGLGLYVPGIFNDFHHMVRMFNTIHDNEHV